ncbi:MAG: ATP-dependent helicase [bacterium]|jgi:DNA helicase-2/ATP-dependent DNA helicase PcrA|nr:ATP-dependent helicase [candidate division KSB1 bacterium]MDH7561480.1 ATP-dependent helicase [bacterium]
MTWQDNLTPEQQQAVSSTGVHARLLAGPGTGKTLVLTRRILYLVHDIGVTASDILTLTFTRAAAAELRRRITNEFGNGAMPHISTLHSYALSLILQRGARGKLPTPIRIADDFEERFIIEEDLKHIMGLSRVTEARELLNQLSADWERLIADADGYRAPNPQFHGAWQEHRQIFGYTLRAELVYQLKHALEEGIVGIEQKPKHIVVDEYQDLDPCDLAVSKGLTEHGAELYVAGDDDQSIYGFRYADPEGIRRFDKDYTPSVSLDLKECKRCGSQILALANYVANQDPRRLPKTIAPAAEVPSGEVHILNFANQSREADAIAHICQWLVTEQNIQPEQILI